MEIQWLYQSVAKVFSTPHPIQLINRVARVCYQSKIPSDIDQQRNFVRNLIKNGHESPLEFVTFIWFLTTTRAIANELVRHRMASYMQESSRYITFDKLPLIVPEGKDNYELKDIEEKNVIDSLKIYKELIDSGVSKQFARDVLPLGLATRLYCQMNLREFRHFLKLRTSKAAHPMMQSLAMKMFKSIWNHSRNQDDIRAMLGDIIAR